MPADAAHPSQSPAQRASETQTLVAVSSAHLISHFYSMVLPVLLPLLKDRLDVSFLDLAFALTAFSVVTGLTQAPVGFLVDKVGARPILIAGLLLGGFAFVSLAPATSYAWLLLVRRSRPRVGRRSRRASCHESWQERPTPRAPTTLSSRRETAPVPQSNAAAD